jgi:hypothetical protein
MPLRQNPLPLAWRRQPQLLHIGVYHNPHQVGEMNARLPIERRLRPAGVGQQIIHLRRPEVARVNFDVILPIQPHIAKRFVQEFPHRMAFPRTNNQILRLILLQHLPHGYHVVGGVAPIPLGVQVAQVELVLLSGHNRRQRPRNLARDKGLAPSRRLMVEQNAVAGKKAIPLAVVARQPVGVQFGGGVGALRLEGVVSSCGGGALPNISLEEAW